MFIAMIILKLHSMISTDTFVGKPSLEIKAPNVSTNNGICWKLYIVFLLYPEYSFYLLTCI
jgi:hypothetical protein